MVRIGGGVFPHIKEEDYYGRGQVSYSIQSWIIVEYCIEYQKIIDKSYLDR